MEKAPVKHRGLGVSLLFGSPAQSQEQTRGEKKKKSSLSF